MKKYTFIIALYFIGIVNLMANDSAYVEAMKSQLEKFEAAKSAEDFQAVANGFSRIGEMNATEWLPMYYTAFSLTKAGFRTEGVKEKDAFFKQAQDLIDKAVNQHGENSELVAMKGYALMGELSVDPGSRGQHMSGLVMNTYRKALSYDPENPRAMILMAQMEYGTAKFFGQGPEKACGMAKKSLQLFELEASTVNDNPLAPKWGKDMAEKMSQQCQ
ncbi:hypothetical protein SAMN05661096_03519 [Marivirga sericea]|uniref:Tetratricopeptide repeat-containing protein n=1 Tax=Marivirga sericea TaxID=1028 RepID=A0A1X7L4J8_9BACT|nr:hypothetical protein [Marivirga sericea]SMG48781.1 hypothetical protein SAMN05661096_03519 [Marivirga sericea]